MLSVRNKDPLKCSQRYVKLLVRNNNGTMKELMVLLPERLPIYKHIDSIYNCYLLLSYNKKAKRKVYCGYTIDVIRRLRQHNGLILGGAKRTRKGRPWNLICYVTGFPDSRTALQFEYFINRDRHHSLFQRLERFKLACTETKIDHGSIRQYILTIYWHLTEYMFPSSDNYQCQIII
jgi:predicted GIY-YIG superfamily endonuclease